MMNEAYQQRRRRRDDFGLVHIYGPSTQSIRLRAHPLQNIRLRPPTPLQRRRVPNLHVRAAPRREIMETVELKWHQPLNFIRRINLIDPFDPSNWQPHRSEGLTAEELSCLPDRLYGPVEQEKFRTCSVCQDDFVLGEKVITLNCFHIFHDACIHPWLKHNSTCPDCRSEQTKTHHNAL